MIDFNDFNNSNIPDEMLAAYIDGNATESENQLIESSLNSDSMLSEAYEIAHDGVSFGSSFNWELHKGDFGFWELGLPPAVTEEELMNAAETANDDMGIEGTDFGLDLDAFDSLDDDLSTFETLASDDLSDTSISGEWDDVGDINDTLVI